MEIFFEGTRLAAWGIGLLLVAMVWVRLVNVGHHYLAAKFGPVPSPTVTYSILEAERPITGLIVAMIVGLIAPLAFSAPILEDHVTWLKIDGINESASILSTHLLILAELYFINRVVSEPREKIVWAACWYGFSMGLACLSLV